MVSIARRLLAVLALTAAAASQSNSSSSDSSDSETTTGGQCSRSIASSNASGIFTFDVDYPLQGRLESGRAIKNIPNPSWAVTVDGGNGQSIQRRLWYDTAGQDYADDLAINYDVCAFVFSSLPTNTLRLGQNDPGDCSSVFTQRCIDNLTYVASASAHQWVSYSSPPPYENLTAGVLPSICGYISRDIFEAAKEQCGNELGVSDDITKNNAVINNEGEQDSRYYANAGSLLFPSWLTPSKAMTGYNASILYKKDCASSADGRAFHHVPVAINRANSDWRAGIDAGYDNATRDVLPILTVYMPVANVERTSVYSRAPSVLQCARVKRFSEGSRVSPELPAGTPWPSPANGLSTKVKGGIAAGVVVFVVLVGSLLFCLWFIKRKKRRSRDAAARFAVAPGENEQSPREADGPGIVHELSPNDKKHELDSVSVAEMEGGEAKPSELADDDAPVELPVENGGR